jgi:hypothetical protein
MGRRQLCSPAANPVHVASRSEHPIRSPELSPASARPPARFSQSVSPNHRQAAIRQHDSPVASSMRVASTSESPIRSPELSPVSTRTLARSPSSAPQLSPRGLALSREEFSQEFHDLVTDWLRSGSEAQLPDLLRFNELSDEEKTAFYSHAER